MNNKSCKKFRRVTVTPKIDNKAHRFNVSTFLKPFEFQQDIRRVRKIDQDNLDLLRKMNVIHRLGGKVDCWAPDIEYQPRFLTQNRRNYKIMEENRKLLKQINKATSGYSAREFLKDWENQQRLVEHRFRTHDTSRASPTTGKKPVELSNEEQLISQNRTRCFFDVGFPGEEHSFGRIVFELYNDIVPRTCENFAALCRGDNNGLSYKNTPFHRIVLGYWCQGGDVTKCNGTGGASIYGESFDNENFELRHAEPGVLSMHADDNGRNDSKFNLTFKRLLTVDGRNVVFGRVIGGMTNVYKIEEFGTKTGKPIKSVIVLNCGVLSARRTHEKPPKPQI